MIGNFEFSPKRQIRFKASFYYGKQILRRNIIEKNVMASFEMMLVCLEKLTEIKSK